MSEKAPKWFTDMHKLEKKELLRRFAVADEEKFCAAFMNDDDRGIRRKAVEMLEDQDRLWYYAVNDPDGGVRSAAVVRLTDNDRLLSITKNDEDRQVQADAAATITDREMLYELASSHPDRWVRKSAILAMKDDDDLMMIVFSETEENGLRLIAAQKVRDQECLKYIINNGEKLSAMDHHNAIRESSDLRQAAVFSLDDHEMLRAIAADYGERRIVRMAAVVRLGADDQDILEMIAEKPYDPDPRRDPDLYYDPGMKAAAVARLTDRDLLRAYLDDPEKETRAAARIALGDEDILKETATDWNWPLDVRKKALKKINDRDFLFDFAMHHVCDDAGETELAVDAVHRIYDTKKLAELAIGAEDFSVSEAAAESICEDDDQILRIISEIENHKENWASSVVPEALYVWEEEMKISAANNLEDLKPLVRLALNDPGDHYDIINFKEHCIGLLNREPALMLDYVRREKDEWALSLASNLSADEAVLQAIADKGLKDTYSAHKLKNLRRIGEVGLRREDEKMQFWKDVLETVSGIGVRSVEDHAAGEHEYLAKLMMLWLYHSGEHFAVHVSGGEPYEDWNRCKEIADKALKTAAGEVLDCSRTASERAELRSFMEECEKGAYDPADIRRLVRLAFSNTYDKSVLEEAEEKAVHSIDYVRFKTYSLEEARKDQMEAPHRSRSSEPPPWLDEFEYIDWVITH